MKIQFNSMQVLDGKLYAKGEAVISDKKAYTKEFKDLVKAGHVSIIPRTIAEQKVQANRDAFQANKASEEAKV